MREKGTREHRKIAVQDLSINCIAQLFSEQLAKDDSSLYAYRPKLANKLEKSFLCS